MFLRRYQRTKDGKRHSYFALVESHRTKRGPRQRIVAQLGELSADEQRRWQRTAVFHTRHENGRELPLFLQDDSREPIRDPDVVRISLGKVGWTNARAFGDVWLGWQLWRRLRLDEIVERHLPTGRETVPPATMVAIEVISRLCIGQDGETSEFGLAEQGYRRKALAHLLQNAGLKTRIRKKDPDDPDAAPPDRPMSPAVALKLLHDVQIGDILLETVEGRKLRLRRVARPHGEQAEIITALGFMLPERICADRDVTPREFAAMSSDAPAPN